MDKFKVVCASELGSMGMQLWGVAEDGLRYTFQNDWFAPWANWSKSSKRDFVSLTAARNAEGLTSLWAVDSNGALVSNGSSGLTWRDEWAPNPTPVKFALICLCEPSDKVGRQLWGVGPDASTASSSAANNALYYKRELQGGNWSPWATWTGFQNVTALMAAQDGYGWTALWALDNKKLISSALGPKGWSSWVPNDIPANFVGICVCKQVGGLGRAQWAVGEKGELWWHYQPDPMQGGWTGWQEFPGPGRPVKSLCVGRNDGRVTLWALSQDDSLHNITQTTAGHDWADFEDRTKSKWDAGGTRPPSKPSLLTEIATVIGSGTGSKYRGVTYEVTSHNTFTLLDTPHLWDKSDATAPPPEKNPAYKNLQDEIANTISMARTIVDITLMWETGGKSGLPSGDFQKALNQGFRSLVKSGSLPLVRIMIGIPIGPWVFPPNLHSWVKTVIERDEGPKINEVKFPILIGAGKEALLSWNHSKIVAADGVRAVVGGHNLWSNHYLGANPVHDVSGLFEGSVVRTVHRFCDRLWKNFSEHVLKDFQIPGAWKLKNGAKTRVFQKYQGKMDLYPGIGLGQAKGNTRMMALGRLGDGIVKEFTVATNASVSARIIALCRAKSNIRISQQSLYNTVEGLTTGFDFYTLLAIIKAVQAGVEVKIVITNDVPLSEGGYKGFLPKVRDSLASLQVADGLGIFAKQLKAVSPKREDIVTWANVSLTTPTADIPLRVSRLPTSAESDPLLKQLNAKLQLARLYYAPDRNYWQVGSEKKNAANHAKVYIIDDTHFYVGSDNMYFSASRAGLQEYGYLIEGKAETEKFIEEYWEKLWNNSKKYLEPATLPKFLVRK